MQTENLVAVEMFCISHNIEISFINTLHKTGLIEILTIKKTGYIGADQLPKVEKYIRLHYDLDINPEGIQTIEHLLERVNCMRDEITELRNRLRLYEFNEENPELK